MNEIQYLIDSSSDVAVLPTSTGWVGVRKQAGMVTLCLYWSTAVKLGHCISVTVGSTEHGTWICFFRLHSCPDHRSYGSNSNRPEASILIMPWLKGWQTGRGLLQYSNRRMARFTHDTSLLHLTIVVKQQNSPYFYALSPTSGTSADRWVHIFGLTPWHCSSQTPVQMFFSTPELVLQNPL